MFDGSDISFGTYKIRDVSQMSIIGLVIFIIHTLDILRSPTFFYVLICNSSCYTFSKSEINKVCLFLLLKFVYIKIRK